MSLYYPELTVSRPQFLGGTNWILKNVTDITVVFGRNGAGKSFLLRGIFNIDHERRFLISPERSGEFQWQAQFLQEESTSEGRSSQRQSNSPTQYRERIISRTNVYLTSYALEIKKRSKILSPNEFEDFIKILLPDFSFNFVKSPPFISMKRMNGEEVSTKDHLSSGEIGLLFLALDIISISALWEIENKDERLLLIDEPDTHLHPDLQRQFSEFLVRVAERFNLQVLISTHSTAMLSSIAHYGQKLASLIYIDNQKEEQPAVSFTQHLNKMSNILGGHALMGPLFSLPMLLVEGSDDFMVWNQVSRSPNGPKLSVIDCDGESKIKEYKKQLENIFNSLVGSPGNTIGFALKDGDNKGQPNYNRNHHIQNLRLNCHELENLYLTNEVIAELGYANWTDAQAAIIADASSYGSLKTRLQNAASWDRQKSDIKELITAIASILDKQKVPWQVRLGKIIGKTKPEGQLNNFLGEKVMSSLWT